MRPVFAFLILFMAAPLALTQAAGIEVFPQNPIQGEPILITLAGISATSSVKNAYFEKQPLNFFLYQNKVSALLGIDLAGKTGTSTISATLKDGTKLSKEIVVGKRPKIEEPLGIPEKLGGNTLEAAAKLVESLVNEQKILNRITSIVRPKAFWRAPFRFPVTSPIVTDIYGYSRDTIGYSIPHKGTDFRAPEKTPVLAINRGVVRMTGAYRTFGKTIMVDHGLGLYSIYLHLSKIRVNIGELVLPGQIIGYSGQTGYAERPHLHLSIRLNGISIDPIKFFELFGISPPS